MSGKCKRNVSLFTFIKQLNLDLDRDHFFLFANVKAKFCSFFLLMGSASVDLHKNKR